MTIANQNEYDYWNGENGQRWVDDADHRDRVLQSVADVLLDAANPQPGERVLDIGCGCGATTLRAARAAGPAGAVTGLDISDAMLGVAKQRLADAALPNVSLLQADAQTFALNGPPYDLAISRFGTMFFNDPVVAFTNVATALRSGGRLCFATWQPLTANQWLTMPGAVLLQYGTLPESDENAPGMFAQSDPSRISDVLTAAGFTDITIDPVTVPLYLGADATEAAAYLADTGPGRAVLQTVPADQRPHAVDAVRRILDDHHRDDGVYLEGAILITRARSGKPAQSTL